MKHYSTVYLQENAWAEYIMESLALYGDKADVVFQSHNWPHWGNDIIQEYMINKLEVCRQRSRILPCVITYIRICFSVSIPVLMYV